MVDRPDRAIPPTARRSARLRKRIRPRAFYIQSFLTSKEMHFSKTCFLL